MRTNQIVKYSLFVSCYLFWVASGLMISVGMYAKLCNETSIVDSLVADPAFILIAVGILMFAITFIGCMGALRDIHVLLKIFAGVMVLVLILQFVAAILGFMFSGMVIEKATSVMSKAITRYRDDLDLQNLIDYLQKKFQCCGVKTYRDWSLNIYFYCVENNPSLESCGVPYSCCIKEKGQNVINTMCGYETQNRMEWDAGDRIYVEGCLKKIVTWGRGNLLLLGGVAMGLIVLEILVICLAVVMIYDINFIMERRKSTVPVTSVRRKQNEEPGRDREFVRELECREVENIEEYMSELVCVEEEFPKELECMEVNRREEEYVRELHFMRTVD